MLKILSFLLFFLSSLSANMGAILLLPTNAKPVIGIYTGTTKTKTDIEIKSTDNSIDGDKYTYNNDSTLIGVFIGAENEYYRLSFSFDKENTTKLQLDRFLINLDYKLTSYKNFKPMFGFGIGASSSTYNINNKEINQENGTIVFRIGSEVLIEKSNSIEILIEYSNMLTSNIGKSFYENNEFTTYDIKKQNSIMLRIGYNFKF